MKQVAVVVAVITMSLTTFAVAAEKTITLNTATQLNGTSLKPGEYKVSYSVNGQTADVKILKGNETLTSTTGQVVALPTAPRNDSVVNRSNSDGSHSIVEMHFAGKKDAIRFTADQAEKGK